jgi:4-amino-4-deoxy-L-arabinose transferase-like glycosyltransferase
MPITMAAARRWGLEAILAMVAGSAFLGFLGSTELWGKREQRASAEALDTVDHGRWLVAEIQGRPRLEKPPLPRWITSALMIVTGRRDETIVRLPNALAGLATVALVYGLGRAIGGRSVGLSAGFALGSSFYFLVEMRQAGNDGFLTLFTTLAMLAAWKRLNGLLWSPPPLRERVRVGGRAASPEAAEQTDQRQWSFLFYGSLGLGFLTKGPIILLMVGLPIVGYLASARRLGSGVVCGTGPGLAVAGLAPRPGGGSGLVARNGSKDRHARHAARQGP